MNNLFEQGKYLAFCTLPLIFNAFLPNLPAIAGGFDTPSYDENFPESLMGTKSEDAEPNQTEVNQAEQSNLTVEASKSSVTILPTTFDFTDWQETQKNDDINCKSDGFNIVCLHSDEAEALAW